MLTQNFQNLFHIEIDSPHRKKLNHTCYWGMGPVLFDSVGMNIFFSVLNLRLMKELKRYSYDHFLDILSVADIYQPNPFGDISTNVYNLLKSVVIEVITSQIKKRE